MTKTFLLVMIVLAHSSLMSLAANAQVEIASTIKPLQLIAAAITAGVSQPSLILSGNDSPHHAALRPSQRQAINDADLLLWIGPNMETSLSKVFEELEVKKIRSSNLPRLRSLSLRNGVDPHLWLNTDNALAIAIRVTHELSELDDANRAQYENNLEEFKAALINLNSEIRSKLSKQEQHTFAVYHNAFQYYEDQFGLQHVVSFTDDEELKPGIRRHLAIRKSLLDNNVSCLLIEPGINPNEISGIIENPDMEFVSIDVLGLDTAVNKNGYVELMRLLTDDLIKCLG